jgi:hypothetical protein
MREPHGDAIENHATAVEGESEARAGTKNLHLPRA